MANLNSTSHNMAILNIIQNVASWKIFNNNSFLKYKNKIGFQTNNLTQLPTKPPQPLVPPSLPILISKNLPQARQPTMNHFSRQSFSNPLSELINSQAVPRNYPSPNRWFRISQDPAAGVDPIGIQNRSPFSKARAFHTSVHPAALYYNPFLFRLGEICTTRKSSIW